MHVRPVMNVEGEGGDGKHIRSTRTLATLRLRDLLAGVGESGVVRADTLAPLPDVIYRERRQPGSHLRASTSSVPSAVCLPSYLS